MTTLKVFFLKWLTIPGFMSFTDKYGSYRITGYYYRYFFADGKSTDPRPCKRSQANCIGGYGVGGSYGLFEEVKSVRIKFNRARLHFFKEYHKRSELEYRRESYKYVDYLKTLPKGLAREEFDEITLEHAVDQAMKSLRAQNS